MYKTYRSEVVAARRIHISRRTGCEQENGRNPREEAELVKTYRSRRSRRGKEREGEGEKGLRWLEFKLSRAM